MTCFTRFPTRRLLSTAFAMVMFCFSASAGELYRTDFENFPVGDDMWVGTDDWLGNSPGVGAHGIDQDVIPSGGLGKTAFIGFRQPTSTFVFVAKPINYDPGPADLPVVEVETLMGIEDSTIGNPNRDSFFVSVWNGAGNYLAGVRFSNNPNSYGIWRNDGTATEEDTGVVFVRGELNLLFLRIDLANNRWSAEIGGVPLFDNAPFTATANPVDFGYLSYEWQLTASSPAGYGDNWMLVADTIVRSAPRPIEPFRITSITLTGDDANITWPGQNGFDYLVEYSEDLLHWFGDLPGASFPGIATDQVLSFTDPSATPARYYRVARTETP